MRIYHSYHLSGVSPLHLDVGYLLTAAPVPTVWPWTWGNSSQLRQCLPSDLGRGVSPHGQSSKAQPPLLTLDMSISPQLLLLTKVPYDPVIPLLGICPEEIIMKKKKNTCILMFTTTLFTIARTWKHPRCLSTDEWISKLWYIYAVK